MGVIPVQSGQSTNLVEGPLDALGIDAISIWKRVMGTFAQTMGNGELRPIFGVKTIMVQTIHPSNF